MHSVIDLFAGAGGLSTGLKSAGFKIIGAVEADATSAATYQMNHPNTKMFLSDIRKVTGTSLLKELDIVRGELDLLTGCPPCQGFSTLRTKRRNVAEFDPRNELVFEILRLTRSIRPQSIIFENVPGFTLDQRFRKFCEELSKCGYSTKHAVLDATNYGVPQRRRRLVLLCLRNSRPIPHNWSFPLKSEIKTVRDSISHLPSAGKSGDLLHDFPEQRSPNVMERIKAIPKDGGSRKDIPPELALRCHLETDGYTDVYGRMAWDKVSPTITSGCTNPSKGRFLHPNENRAITLREAALLQTFPQKYKFDLSRGKGNVSRQIGNAFPPKLIEPIARRLYRELI
jgi:DNA (cytosine-5)-methyltransferase 1